MLSEERRRFSRASQCPAARRGTLENDPRGFPRSLRNLGLTEVPGLVQAYTRNWNPDADLPYLFRFPVLLHS